MMVSKSKKNDPFQDIVKETISSLQDRDMDNAGKLVTILVSMDMDAPEPHNLFGILSELKGNDDSARKHYRAAYALDPTYKPACRNLERLVLGTKNGGFDFGLAEIELADRG
jgi:Flp pilus assembly protein TadD